MAKTIKQLADDLGISKQAVQQRMNDIPAFRDQYTKKVGNRLVINDTGVSLLTNNDKQERQSTSDKKQERQAKIDKNDKQNGKKQQGLTDDLTSALLNQLNTKDEQIAQLQKALDQQQQLQLAIVQENHQLKERIEHLGGYVESGKNNKQAESDSNTEKSTEPAKKGFWGRLFGK